MWRWVIALVVAFTLTGCGPMFESGYQGGPVEGDYGYGSPNELGPLLDRRDAEQVLAERDQMITEITTALSEIVPGSHWQPRRKEDSVHCGDFGSTNGKRYFSRHYAWQEPIPATLWDQASQAVIDIAAKYGYTNASRSENVGDDDRKSVTITDDEGGRYTLGSMYSSNFNVVTGCYLTAEDKRKALDAAPK